MYEFYLCVSAYVLGTTKHSVTLFLVRGGVKNDQHDRLCCCYYYLASQGDVFIKEVTGVCV